MEVMLKDFLLMLLQGRSLFAVRVLSPMLTVYPLHYVAVDFSVILFVFELLSSLSDFDEILTHVIWSCC